MSRVQGTPELRGREKEQSRLAGGEPRLRGMETERIQRTFRVEARQCILCSRTPRRYQFGPPYRPEAAGLVRLGRQRGVLPREGSTETGTYLWLPHGTCVASVDWVSAAAWQNIMTENTPLHHRHGIDPVDAASGQTVDIALNSQVASMRRMLSPAERRQSVIVIAAFDAIGLTRVRVECFVDEKFSSVIQLRL